MWNAGTSFIQQSSSLVDLKLREDNGTSQKIQSVEKRIDYHVLTPKNVGKTSNLNQEKKFKVEYFVGPMEKLGPFRMIMS